MLQLTTILFLIAFSMLAVLHIIALTLSLYWHFWWFDIPMHLFGGMVVALGFFTLRDLHILGNTWFRLITIISLVFVIAIAWELFEFVAGVPIDENYISDTSLDLLMGVCGGSIGYYVGTRLRNLR